MSRRTYAEVKPGPIDTIVRGDFGHTLGSIFGQGAAARESAGNDQANRDRPESHPISLASLPSSAEVGLEPNLGKGRHRGRPVSAMNGRGRSAMNG